MATVVSTKPFEGQRPGTSGLRKPVSTFQQPHYLENFVQCMLDVALEDVADRSSVQLVLGGDGRFHSKPAIRTIMAMCAANQVGRLIVAQDGLMSTPAVSAVIRARNARGGIILTASHNPGGQHGDFGVKYNCENGGPAPDHFTERIYERSGKIEHYRTLANLQPVAEIDLSRPGQHRLEAMLVEVVDPVETYLALLRTIFDFELLKRFVAGQRLLVDAMHGVMGPYVRRILVLELGAGTDCAHRCQPLEDFGGHHPDPNLTYAADLLERMRTGSYDLGAAFDGDGDRNMVLGAGGFFVTPSDSLAVLAEHLHLLPWFAKPGRVRGVARSMPTARAVDRVAQASQLPCYETPTGWKYFGSLLDAGLVSICGEESFGTGSDHIREKDGMWALLAWLSVMAQTGRTVQQLVHDHWRRFGRYFYARHDYENCPSEPCREMMAEMETAATTAGGRLAAGTQYRAANEQMFQLDRAFAFGYTDPVTGRSESSGQGLVFLFENGSARIVFRLSGTGSTGATVRIYLERFEPDPDKACTEPAGTYLDPLAEVAVQLSQITKYTGRERPTVIT